MVAPHRIAQLLIGIHAFIRCLPCYQRTRLLVVLILVVRLVKVHGLDVLPLPL